MRGAFRIVDPECMQVLTAMTTAFEHADLPFGVAGGMGVQALLAARKLDHLGRATSTSSSSRRTHSSCER